MGGGGGGGGELGCLYPLCICCNMQLTPVSVCPCVSPSVCVPGLLVSLCVFVPVSLYICHTVAHLTELGEHDNGPALSVVNHLPEISGRGVHGTLGYDECFLLLVALGGKERKKEKRKRKRERQT